MPDTAEPRLTHPKNVILRSWFFFFLIFLFVFYPVLLFQFSSSSALNIPPPKISTWCSRLSGQKLMSGYRLGGSTCGWRTGAWAAPADVGSLWRLVRSSRCRGCTEGQGYKILRVYSVPGVEGKGTPGTPVFSDLVLSSSADLHSKNLIF
ncbi:hypothetical protein VULLAG_LOCUS12796 [Vulpes lagopus]